MTTAALAAAIERDLLKDDTAEDSSTAECFSCGRHMVLGRARFCSNRCREFYDTGEPGYRQDWLKPTLGLYPGMRRGRHGFFIDCRHCGGEFESRGLRCCSPKCEAELRKAPAVRKHRRPRIAHYAVKVDGRGYWQPSSAIRALGFRSRDCGSDGPLPRKLSMRPSAKLD
jgi:hypothetical protein